jgi:hypothetical protein
MAASRGSRALDEAIHWALIRQREAIMEADPNDEGFVVDQALQCPYYVPLEGSWGSDWGCIMHPRSKKFGQLVFEHEWCGCASHFAEEAIGRSENSSAETEAHEPS